MKVLSFINSTKNNKGFTLPELLIAMAISALVGVGIYSVFKGFIGQTKKDEMELEAEQSVKVAINMIQRDLQMAGYLPGVSADAIDVAEPNRMQFNYTNEIDESPLAGLEFTSGFDVMNTTAGQPIGIEYEIVTPTGSIVPYLTKTIYTYSGGVFTEAPGMPISLMPYVQNLEFKYYASNGSDITSYGGLAYYTVADATAAGVPAYDAEGNIYARESIRVVEIMITVRTKDIVPSTGDYKYITYKTQMKLRNMGIGETSRDVTPPPQVTGVSVRDPGACNTMLVRWDASPATDVENYLITATGGGTESINLIEASQDATFSSGVGTSNGYDCDFDSGLQIYTCTVWNSNLLHSPSNADGLGEITYSVTVLAKDKTNNGSPSAAALNDPATNQRDFTVAYTEDDTTFHVFAPAPLTYFMSTQTLDAGNLNVANSLSLSWEASTELGIQGYRIYRSETPFTTFPIPVIYRLAAEDGVASLSNITINPTDTSFVDTSLALSCIPYYYAIAPVGCDATLVESHPNDTAEEYYDETNYFKITDGDIVTDPYGVDKLVVAQPVDAVVPSPPNIHAIAGWKRIFVTLIQSPADRAGDPSFQPGTSDVSHTCIYVHQDNFITTTETVPTIDYADMDPANECPRASGGFTNTAGIYEGIVPDSGGSFDYTEVIPAATTSFTNESLTEELTFDENLMLLNEGTYTYAAVSFDFCGNHSDLASAQNTTTNCDDNPAGYPPASTDAILASCDADSYRGVKKGASFSWLEEPLNIAVDPSLVPPNHLDIAGYRVLKKTYETYADYEAGTASSTDMISTLDTPVGFSPDDADTYITYSDPDDAASVTGIVNGKVYEYFAATTDCNYEKYVVADYSTIAGAVNPDSTSTRVSPFTGSGDNGLNYTYLGSAFPGVIERGEKCADASLEANWPVSFVATNTETCEVGDGHRQIVTGVNLRAGTGAAYPQDSLEHDSVTLFLQNTSAGEMNLTDLSISWSSPTAKLTEVTVGGGRAQNGEVVTSIAQIPADTTNDPYTKTLSNLALAPYTFPDASGDQRYVPITFKFSDLAGDPIDMRGEFILLEFESTNAYSDSGRAGYNGTEGCFSYPTVLGDLVGYEGGFVVPQGPSVNSVTLDAPFDPTASKSVPGPSGLASVPTDGIDLASTVVPALRDVNFTVNGASNTTHGETNGPVDLVDAKLFYWVETTGNTTATGPNYTPDQFEMIQLYEDGTNVFTTKEIMDDNGTPGDTSDDFTAIHDNNTPANPADDFTLNANPLPYQNTKDNHVRVWYFTILTDADGNYTRSPSVDEGFYVYDQKIFDPCDFTPEAPEFESDVVTATYINPKFEGPFYYTDGTRIDLDIDDIGYNAYRSYTASPFAPIGNHDGVTDIGTWVNQGVIPPSTGSGYWLMVEHKPDNDGIDYPYLRSWDYIDPSLDDYSYAFEAKNSCNKSEMSLTYKECYNSAGTTLQVSSTDINTDDTFDILVSSCALSGNGIVDTFTVQYTTTAGAGATVTITETDQNSGNFTSTIQSTSNGAFDGVPEYVLYDPLNNTTVNVSCVTTACAPTDIDVAITVDPCVDIPVAPVLNAISHPTNTAAILTWSASISDDLTGYRIYRDDLPIDYVNNPVTVGSATLTYTDTSMPTKLNQAVYTWYVTAIDSCSAGPNESTYNAVSETR